jgi:flavin reductase ActVB
MSRAPATAPHRLWPRSSRSGTGVAREPLTAPQAGTTAVGAAAFRDALAHVATPVAVVTTVDSAGSARGLTISTLCSLSLTPPLVMFCLDQSGSSHQVITTTKRLLIHVLRADQSDIAARFARTGIDRFEGLAGRWHGLPTIPDTAVRLACSRHAVAPGGDHTVVICLVEDAETGSDEPLLYHARRYCIPQPLTAGTAREQVHTTRPDKRHSQ